MIVLTNRAHQTGDVSKHSAPKKGC